MKKLINLIVLAIIALFALNMIAVAEDNDTTIPEDETLEETNGTGLITMTDEEWANFRSTLPRIVDIKPNEIAMSRLEGDASLSGEIDVADITKETTVVFPGETMLSSEMQSEFPLTSAVDVSQSLTFPVIGNQGYRHSCVAWALGYYQLTNNTCVARGLNAKTELGEAVEENVMSPRFIYTLINGGWDNGAYYSEACAAIMYYGCPTIDLYSETMTSSNIKSWCTDTATWNSAIYNKPQYISYDYIETDENGIVTATTDGVVRIKKILSNGYVVTIPTYASNFVITHTTSTGASACRYMKNDNKTMGHAMTIVGYDDTFWVDINDNETEDVGELGAFKVANSWGKNDSDYTDGYIWIPYDALGETSSLLEMPDDRAGAFCDYYFIEAVKEYTPLLIANVEISSSRRNQISIEIGVSNISSNSPDEIINIAGDNHIAFNNAAEGFIHTYGGYSCKNFNFSGGNTEESIIIPFDLTNIIKKAFTNGISEGKSLKLYIRLTDCMDNNKSATLGNIIITEPFFEKTYSCSNSTDLVANNSSVIKDTICQITPFVSYMDESLILTFNNFIDKSSIKDAIYLTRNDERLVQKIKANDSFNNEIIVYAPNKGYDYDVIYYLHINTSLKSKGNNFLNTEELIPIYIPFLYLNY